MFMRRLCAILYRALVNTERPFSPFFGLPASSADALDRWIDALDSFSLDDWLRSAESGNHQPHSMRDAARHAVGEAITNHSLEVTAWFVRDMIVTTMCRSTRRDVLATPRIRRALADARSHAQWAALAIATQSWLQPAHVRLLCSPFSAAQIISLKGSTTLAHQRAIRSIVGDQPSLSQAHGD